MLSPKEVVNKWVDAFNASDVDMISSLYDNNATNHQVANEPVVGVVAIREMFANEFATAKMVCIVENIFERWAMGYLRVERPVRITWVRIFPCCK